MFCACPVCPSGIYTSVNVHTLLLNRAIQRAAHGSKILVYKELAAFTKARSQTAPESVVSGKHGHDLCNSCQINQLRSGTGQDVPVPLFPKAARAVRYHSQVTAQSEFQGGGTTRRLLPSLLTTQGNRVFSLSILSVPSGGVHDELSCVGDRIFKRYVPTRLRRCSRGGGNLV